MGKTWVNEQIFLFSGLETIGTKLMEMHQTETLAETNMVRLDLIISYSESNFWPNSVITFR